MPRHYNRSPTCCPLITPIGQSRATLLAKPVAVQLDGLRTTACGTMELARGLSMSSTREDLDNFNQFAAERLASGYATASLDELFMEWHDRRAREEINRAIRQGLADVDAGRYQPASEAMEMIRKQFGFSKE